MKGLIVLVPYDSGQEFYPESEYDDDYYDEDVDKDKQEDNFDKFSLAIPEDEDESEYDEKNKDNDASDKILNSTEAYLPVYVETDDKDLALMVVAYATCVDYCYVAFPSTWQTAQQWEEREYSGTLKSPAVELPSTEAAFTILEPGDCFCCGSLEDYTVYSLEEFRKSLKISRSGYILWVLENDQDLWEQFNNWSTRILNYELISELDKNSIDTQEIILVDTKEPKKLMNDNTTLFNSEIEWLD